MADKKFEVSKDPAAKSLCWLSNMFPFNEAPMTKEDKMCNAIHVYTSAGAVKITDLIKENEFLKAQLAENTSSNPDVVEETEKKETTLELNEETVGGICNSLNSMEGLYHSEKTALPVHLHQAQELIWLLWNQHKDVAYLCDRRKCKTCNRPSCLHTTDISHAANFQNLGGKYIEQELQQV